MRFFLGLILLSALTTSCRSSSLKATEQTGQINIPNQQATATPSLFDQIINNDDELSPSYSFGSPVGIESLEITPVEYEIDHQYTLEDGEAITPLSGAINLWIFIRVKNIGANSASTDLIIELYYAGEVLHGTTFGEYQPTNKSIFQWNRIFPDQINEGWVLFEVPENMDLSNAYLAIRPLLSATEYISWKIED